MPSTAALVAGWLRCKGRFGVLPSLPSGELTSVTFPDTDLSFRIQIALGADLTADPNTWPWCDITDYVRSDLGIGISTGLQRSQLVPPGSMSMKLDNAARPGTTYPEAGRFGRRNPYSSFFGLLTKNTPIWVEVDAGSGFTTRAQMFVNEWPTRWTDKTATDSTVTIACGGILRRLGQGDLIQSPLRRAVLSHNPVHFWPLEDASGSSFAASALPGGGSMLANASPGFGSTGPAGSTAAVDFSSGGTLGASLSGMSSTSWCVLAVVKAAVGSSTETVFSLTMSGGSAWTRLNLANQISIAGFGVSGLRSSDLSTVDSDNEIQVDDDEWHVVALVGSNNGANARVDIYVDDTNQPPANSIEIAGVIGAPTTVTLNKHMNLTPTNLNGSICCVAAFNNITTPPALASVANGYSGEMAHDRIERLCTEEGILYTSNAVLSVPMGAQGEGNALDLIRECEAADGGLLYEKRFGLAYLSSAERANRPVALALDFTDIAELPEPSDNDEFLRNKWTVSRTNGGEATAEETAGPCGSDTVGVYRDSTSVNVETDTQMVSQATWRNHLGTVDEDYWPSVGLNFAATPELIGPYTSLDFAPRITVSNLPAHMPPDPIDAVVDGMSEFLDTRSWRVSLNTSPASIWRIQVVDSNDGNLGRVDMSTSVLTTAITSGATSISVTSTGAVWDTTESNFDINIGGERMTVTVISGASSPQTFTVTRSVNGVVKAHVVNTRVGLWQPAVYALIG